MKVNIAAEQSAAIFVYFLWNWTKNNFEPILKSNNYQYTIVDADVIIYHIAKSIIIMQQRKDILKCLKMS